MRSPRAEDGELTPFEPAEGAPALGREVLREPERSRRVIVDQTTRRQTVETRSDSGRMRWLDLDLETERVSRDRYSIVEGDPLSPRVTSHWRIGLARGGWRVRRETGSVMSCDAERFYVSNLVRAWEGDAEVHQRQRDFEVERHLV